MTETPLVALYVLAVWRFSSLVVHEAGPLDLFLRVRMYAGAYAVGEQSNLAVGIQCMWCVSMWVGIAVTLAHGTVLGWGWWLLALPFALSAGAILFDTVLSGIASRTEPPA